MTGKWVALIPVRGGSKGLPGKNTRPLAGKPLYQHSIDQALRAGASHCYVSTDIPEILETDHGANVSVVKRPDNLALDGTPMDAVLQGFLTDEFHDDAVLVLLQATSPLRTVEDIHKAIETYQQNAFDLVMTVTPTPSGFLKYGMSEGARFVPVSKPEYCFANRQDLPVTYRPNGAVYVFRTAWLKANGGLATDNIGMVEMDPESSFDIDDISDFGRVESRWSERN